MPLAQFKHILSIHITAKQKITSSPSGLITMQQHQPIFSGALWLHCRLQGLLLRGQKNSSSTKSNFLPSFEMSILQVRQT